MNMDASLVTIYHGTPLTPRSALQSRGPAGEPMPTIWRESMIATGVGAVFSAAHLSPEGEMHGHSYEVVAWFRNDNRADARCFKAAVEAIVALWDHKVLPDELSWAEDIARAVGTLANCVEVEVRRPLERLYARYVYEASASPEASPEPSSNIPTQGQGK